MPTTPKLGLPYPDPTAPVAEGASNIRALAEATETTLTAAPWRTYVPAWISGGAPGSGTFIGRYRAYGAGLFLSIAWQLAEGINLPTHVVLGLPPGMVQTPDQQALSLGFNPGPAGGYYPGVGSVLGNQISLYSDSGAPLGAGQLQLGAAVNIQGVVMFTTPPTLLEA